MRKEVLSFKTALLSCHKLAVLLFSYRCCNLLVSNWFWFCHLRRDITRQKMLTRLVNWPTSKHQTSKDPLHAWRLTGPEIAARQFLQTMIFFFKQLACVLYSKIMLSVAARSLFKSKKSSSLFCLARKMGSHETLTLWCEAQKPFSSVLNRNVPYIAYLK